MTTGGMTTLVAPTPEAGSKPAQILDAAGRLFLEHGYGAVSMDTIAKTANVSKATLYAHFRSKDELFSAMVACECRDHMTSLSCEEVGRMEVKEALCLIGRRFANLLLSPKALHGYRMVVGEAPRFPELARAFYEAGPAQSTRQLSAYLIEVDRRGKLKIPNPTLAAEQFVGLLKAPLHMRILFGMADRPSDEEIEQLVDQTVAFFCRGYAPDA